MVLQEQFNAMMPFAFSPSTSSMRLHIFSRKSSCFQYFVLQPLTPPPSPYFNLHSGLNTEKETWPRRLNMCIPILFISLCPQHSLLKLACCNCHNLLFFQKIFVVLYFWLAAIGIITLISVVYNSMVVVSPGIRNMMLR